MARRTTRTRGFRMGTFGILVAVLIALGLAAWVAWGDPQEEAVATAEPEPPAAETATVETAEETVAETDNATAFVDSEVEAPAGGRVPLFYETGTATPDGE